MLVGVLPAWNFKKVSLALALVLPAMVLPAPASADDDPANVAEAGVEQSSIAVPLSLPESRPADAQEPLNSVPDADQVNGSRPVRVPGPERRPCPHLGCSGHSIVGVGH